MALNKSPLRYPGGKQKLSPFITELLELNELTGGHYIEPYAGGAGAAMELLLTRQVGSVHLNDSSYAIYAFWNSLLTQTDEFCRRIRSVDISVEEWRRQQHVLRHPDEYDEFQVGFSTFYLNRCNRSGVLTGGLIGGVAQTGQWKMDARFSRNDLIRRVEAIASYRDNITLTNLDTEVYLAQETGNLPDNTLIYFDPPYYEKASALYLDFYRKADHSRLATIIQHFDAAKWILSYDGAEEIVALYNQRRLFLYDLQYNASRVYKGKEVFIFGDDVVLPQRSSLACIDHALPTLNEAVI